MSYETRKLPKKTIVIISIIIACYNAVEYIEDCIQSIKNQTYDNWEIIVCDDASTDNSNELNWKYITCRNLTEAQTNVLFKQ